MKTYPLLGIFGGTFDPIHHGHCHVLRSCLGLLSWDEFLVMPCHVPALKASAVATNAQRVDMLRLGLAEFEDQVHIDDRELHRPGPTYTIDTVTELQTEFPDKICVLVLGDDAFASLPDWEDWQTILKRCHLIIVNRRHDQSYPPPLLAEIQHRETTDIQSLKTSPGGKIYFLTVPTVDLSSTELRDKLATHLPIDNLVPEKVHAYITWHHLYNR